MSTLDEPFYHLSERRDQPALYPNPNLSLRPNPNAGEPREAGEGGAEDGALVTPGVVVVMGAPLLPELLKDEEQFQMLLTVRCPGSGLWLGLGLGLG